MATSNNPLTTFPRDNILLSPLSTLTPGSTFVNEQNCVSFNLAFTLQGGTFQIQLLKGSVVPLPAEDSVMSMPFGRVGVVRQVGTTWSRSGLIDVISGQLLPWPALQQTFYATPNQTNDYLITIASNLASGSRSGSALIGGSILGMALNWITSGPVPTMIGFSYRGPTLQGIIQAANVMLADVVLRKDGIYVVDPGAICPGGITGGTGFGGFQTGNLQYTPFGVDPKDIVSISQNVDYSLDVASVLNPAILVSINTQLPGQYIYDGQHCQKQPKTTVSAGAPQGTGSTDFIPIPDGWLVDGSFEEWVPKNPAANDFSNPNSSVPNGRYWKQFPSPTNGGMMRGIMTFTRLVKELKIPGNVSGFVGSPITGSTYTGSNQQFVFDFQTTENGIFGFDSSAGALDSAGPGGVQSVGGTTLFDVISDQYITVNNACTLIPPGGNSGFAAQQFYNIQMEFWTFPLVNPITFPQGGNPPSVNPFFIPNGAVVVTPNQSTVNGYGTGYYGRYLVNYRLINSPRLRTTISVVYRNYLPQVGDQLIVNNSANLISFSDCGRIQSVTLNFSRSGVTLNITAEKYQFGSGKWNTLGVPGQTIIGGIGGGGGIIPVP